MFHIFMLRWTTHFLMTKSISKSRFHIETFNVHIIMHLYTSKTCRNIQTKLKLKGNSHCYSQNVPVWSSFQFKKLEMELNTLLNSFSHDSCMRKYGLRAKHQHARPKWHSRRHTEEGDVHTTCLQRANHTVRYLL